MTDATAQIVVEDRVLAAVAARAALATPGVSRLEPGMRGLVSSLVRVGKQRWTGAEPAPPKACGSGATAQRCPSTWTSSSPPDVESRRSARPCNRRCPGWWRNRPVSR